MTSPCRWTATASITRCFWRTWCGPVAEGRLEHVHRAPFYHEGGLSDELHAAAGHQLHQRVSSLLCGPVRILDTTSGFRACNKELTAYFADHYAQDYPEPEAIITAVLNGYRVGEAPVVMEERMGGKSSISPFKSVYYMVKVSIALVVFRITSGRRKEGRV